MSESGWWRHCCCCCDDCCDDCCAIALILGVNVDLMPRMLADRGVLLLPPPLVGVPLMPREAWHWFLTGDMHLLESFALL